MDSINTILKENCSEVEKLKKISKLMDTMSEKDKENINIEVILDSNTEDVDVKFHVLCKALNVTNNFQDNISCLINYFRKSFSQYKNKTFLVKVFIYLLEIEENRNEMPNILNQLDNEHVNSLLFTEIFLQKDESESRTIFKTYLKYLSVDLQYKFFNSLFEFSKFHQNVKWINSIFHNIDTAALTHERSVVRTKDLWIYLTDYLINSQDYAATQIAMSVLLSCIDLVKNAKLELKFLTIDGNETAWNAFFTLMQVFSFGCPELTKPSLELLAYVSSLHYFWRHCIFKLLLQHVPVHLKCAVMVSILQQNIEAGYMRPFVKIMLPEINKRNCSKKDCPVFTELGHFCKNVNVASYAVILDEVLNISWSYHHVWKILRNVLVDSKRNAVDLVYLSQIIKFLNSYHFFASPSYRDIDQIVLFFLDRENFNFWYEIKGSGIPFPRNIMLESKELKNIALPKILELSFQNSDDLETISVFIDFLTENNFYVDMIRQYPLSIHVRMVIYKNLFNMAGYYIAQTKLDQKIAVNDFYLYLKNHLNERNYGHYRGMMVIFLEMNQYMSFIYPEKAFAELLNIIRYPELYTKFQIYCATEIIKWVDYRYPILFSDRNNQYYQLGQKWKSLILETNDNELCKEGLYYVLNKGQLVDAEYNGIVKNLLEKHFCDQVTEEIYRRYLKVDLVDFAFTHLLDIIKKFPSTVGKFSKLFCETIFSKRYLTCDLFDLENDCLKFCFSNEKNLEWSIKTLYDEFMFIFSYDAKLTNRVINIVMKIYLKEDSNAFIKVECANTLLRVTRPYPPNNHQTSIQPILIKTKELYAGNLKNDINKLRIVQLLFLLVPCVTRKGATEKAKKLLKRIVVGISVKESNSKNKTVRQTSQYVYVLLSEGHITIKEIQSIVDQIEEKHNLASSLIPILYHVMPFYDFSTDEMEKLVSSLLSFSISSDLNLQMYTQLLLQRLFNTPEYKNMLEKYESQLIKINLEIENNKEKFVEALGTDYIFLKDLEPLRDNSVETMFYILPKLNQVNTLEWEDIMLRVQRLVVSEREKYNNKKDKDETLNKAVNTYLDSNGKTKKYTAEDVLDIFRLS